MARTDDRGGAGGDRPGAGPPPNDPPAGVPIGDGGEPEDGGLDLQPDVERIHRTVAREPRDPIEGREPVPWFFTAAIVIALFLGGWYLGHYGGTFGTATHIAFGAREPGIAAAAKGQAAGAVADPIVAGRAVYEKNCQVCHQANGHGVPGAFPPVVGSEWVTGPPQTLVRILLHGLQGPVEVAGATYNGAMPAWENVLHDEEIAAVATFLRQFESNKAGPVSAADVDAERKATASRTTPWTAAELKEAEAKEPEAGKKEEGGGGEERATPRDTGAPRSPPATGRPARPEGGR